MTFEEFCRPRKIKSDDQNASRPVNTGREERRRCYDGSREKSV